VSLSPRPGTVFLTATAVWLLAALWYTSDAAIDLPPLVSLLGGAALLLCVAAARALLVRREAAQSRPLSRRDLVSWAALPAALSLAALAACFGLGLRLRLALSAADLRSYPVTAAPDTHESFRNPPVRVGLFWVAEAQAAGLCRRFITTRDFMDDAGLAFCPVGPPPRVGEDRYRSLGGGWWIWSRSF